MSNFENVDAGNWIIKHDGPYLWIEYEGRPGYILIKADDEGFVAGIFPDVGNDPDASMWSCYYELDNAGEDVE